MHAVRLFMRRDRRLVRAALRTWRGAKAIAAARFVDCASPAALLAKVRVATSADAVAELVAVLDGASEGESAPVVAAITAKLMGFVAALRHDASAARTAHGVEVKRLTAALRSASAAQERAAVSVADAHAAQLRERLAAQAAIHDDARAEHATRAASSEGALRAEMDKHAAEHDEAIQALKAVPAHLAAKMLTQSNSGVGEEDKSRLARPFKLRIVGGAARDAGAPLSAPWRGALLSAFAAALELPTDRLYLGRASKSGARTVGARGTLHDVIDIVLWVQPPLLGSRSVVTGAVAESMCRATAAIESRLAEIFQARSSAAVATCGVQRGGRRSDADLFCDAGAQFRCAVARETQLEARQRSALAVALRDGAAHQKVAFTWWQKARALEAAGRTKEEADALARTMRCVADLKVRAAKAAQLSARAHGRTGAAREAKVAGAGGADSAGSTALAMKQPLAAAMAPHGRSIGAPQEVCVHMPVYRSRMHKRHYAHTLCLLLTPLSPQLRVTERRG